MIGKRKTKKNIVRLNVMVNKTYTISLKGNLKQFYISGFCILKFQKIQFRMVGVAGVTFPRLHSMIVRLMKETINYQRRHDAVNSENYYY